ncbi:MAG TPA: pyruvate carboxylase [Anaerovoracaceae bacterium]|nr:pyruvate carboxylase [Anaerovoracaceae bacterium]
MENVRRFKRVLVANRGEIAIRIFRACGELGIRTVAIYSEEDKNALFRTKADEAYEIGKGKSPIDAYLDIDEIINLAVAKGVEAIHPGYGFLSENPEFVEACQNADIEFIGPTDTMMNSLGDKIQSKIVASSVDVPTIPGIESAIGSEDQAYEFANECGYPVMLKAAAGGGGRGMRIVRKEDDLLPQYKSAKSEAKKAFGVDDIFIEKYLENPKHIEVQVLGDKYGNIVHLYERDCSVQRRHQKVIEFTPALCLTDEQRKNICNDAIKIASAVKYRSAGTVEFLLDKDGKHYFIEMNPRIQVEHTVTEMVTGIDLVQSQIMVAEGYPLDSDEIGIYNQDNIKINGYAIQCRVTTEDPTNGFAPDTGTINLYRSASGYGIRLDGGSGFTGSVISPYYDSLLVKVTAWAKRFPDARKKAERALSEMDVKGIKTNIEFLLNVLNHEKFKTGDCDTGFVANNPALMNVRELVDDELRLLDFLGDKIVNETKGQKADFNVPKVPKVPLDEIKNLSGTKQLFDEKGPKGVADWVLGQQKLLVTDTTFRDAQQSLMATRMRSIDMEKIAPAVSYYGRDFFSLEMWGGATFDVSMRFLKEDPWERLAKLREKVPNLMFQMLIRGSNAVGYKNYPDNVIRRFVKEAKASGIDVFRIFDSLNWIEGMSIALDETLNQGGLAEGCLCYTGDILDPSREKYDLNYYIKNAKELEKRGAHILGIKDMSGLLRPMAAKKLVTALKDEISIPIHLHTHDTSGNGVATLVMAAEAGVDIADSAFNSMAGLTSQPGLNSLVAATENSDRDTGICTEGLQKISEYWADVRPVYSSFESGLSSSTAEIYRLEIPGGQYSNLKPQVESFGIGHKFNAVKDMYVDVNQMLGDIIKVTPSSKVVGDLAIFMVQNDLTVENILVKGRDMDYPDSVVSYFEGMIGQPEGGFPEELQKIVLKDKTPITCRPGELLEPEDFDKITEHLVNDLGLEGTEKEALSYAMYPKVFDEYIKYLVEKGNFRNMGSDIFFHGLREGETGEVKLKEGSVNVIKLVEIRNTGESGNRDLVFSVDGNQRVVSIKDKSALTTSVSGSSIQYANSEDPSEIGASITGTVIKVFVEVGDKVKKNQPIAVIEAMKMETNVLSSRDGVIEKVYSKEGGQVKTGELIAKLEENEE